MKTARSYKIILLLTAFVLSIAAAFGMMRSGTPVHAADETPSTYFTGTVASKAEFGEKGLTAAIADGDTFGFKHDVVISDFAMGLTIPKNVVLTITFTSDSYFIHGEKIDDEYTTVIEYSVMLMSNDEGIWIKTTDSEKFEVEESGTNTFDFHLVVGNDNLPTAEGKKLTQNKIENIDGKAIATSVEFVFDVEEGETVAEGDDFVISYINQKDSDGGINSKYCQKLTLVEGKLEKATPRVTLNDSFYTKQKDGSYKLVKLARSDYYSVSMKAYSPISSSNSGLRLFLLDSNGNAIDANFNDKAVLESNTSTPDMVYFSINGVIKLGVGIDENNDYQTIEPKLYETFEIEVIEKDSDTIVPEYVDVTTGDGKIAYDGFLNALKEEYQVTDEDGNTTSVYLGATFEIPSMRDLVYDNVSPVDKLTRKVYVNNGSASTSNSFDLDEIGNYFFYVVYADEAGNEMDNEAFLKKENGELVKVEDKTFTDTDNALVFKFEMNDDAAIKVDAAVAQGLGYKGVTYTASKFTVDASGCTLTYKLYYNSNVNASEGDDGWREVVKKKDATTDADKAMAYDGTLTFNPTEIGSYMIKCTATSEVSSRNDEDFTIIRVKSEPKVVEVPSTWLKDNVWSVVFLSVGTLCLIGIVVLLFIKPKEETDND